MLAAKLASEGGIILRQHVPIYTSWKEYKKDKDQFNDQLNNFIGKLSVRCCLISLIYANSALLHF